MSVVSYFALCVGELFNQFTANTDGVHTWADGFDSCRLLRECVHAPR